MISYHWGIWIKVEQYWPVFKFDRIAEKNDSLLCICLKVYIHAGLSFLMCLSIYLLMYIVVIYIIDFCERQLLHIVRNKIKICWKFVLFAITMGIYLFRRQHVHMITTLEFSKKCLLWVLNTACSFIIIMYCKGKICIKWILQ